MNDLIESQRQTTKRLLGKMADGSPDKRIMFETILENIRRENEIAEASEPREPRGATNVAAIHKIIMPIITIVFPRLLAHEIIGVQVMAADPVNIDVLRIRKDGSQVIIPHEITKTEHKLSNRWTFEAARNAQARPGLDIEAEIMAALAQEVLTEFDQTLLNDLRQLAGNHAVTYKMQYNAVDIDNPFPLSALIHEQADAIGKRNHGRAANWCVISPTVLTILTMDRAFTRHTDASQDSFSYVRFVGMLNGNMKVYVDQFAGDSEPILLGYKGSNVDAAGIYCPYDILLASKVLIDPHTFEPCICFTAHDANFHVQETDEFVNKASDYVSTIEIVA